MLLTTLTKTMDCIFIGYALNSSAYRFLVHKSEIPDIHVNMIIKSRYVVFFEDIFPYKREEDKTSGKRTHEMVFRDESPKEPIDNAKVEPRRSQRQESKNLLVQISQHMLLKASLKHLKRLCLPQKHKCEKKF